jgi:hypothetical protein
MLDAAMLARISECYTAAAPTDESQKYHFGGKDMVIIGDLMQLPPVSEWRNVKPLYYDMVTSALQQNSSRFNKEKRLIDGLTIFEDFRKFELTKQMRCSDKVHTSHIESIRIGKAAQPVCRQLITIDVNMLIQIRSCQCRRGCVFGPMCANLLLCQQLPSFLFVPTCATWAGSR